MASVSDTARANMLTALVLTEPQSLTNVDLMRLVIAGGGLSLVTVTDATAAVHLERYLRSLR